MSRSKEERVLPPFDVMAEEAVVASILLDPNVYAEVADIVAPEDFFREQNRWLFEVAADLFKRGEEISTVTVAHELDRQGKLDELGGEPYLVELAAKYISPVGVRGPAAVVARDAVYRRLIMAAGDIAREAYAGRPELESTVEYCFATLRHAVGRHSGLDIKHVSEVSLTTPTGGTWGIPVLDRYTYGVAPGEVTVLAGSTGDGKSMLAGQIARHVAMRGGRVVIFSMEMTAEEWVRRAVHAEAGVRIPSSRFDSPLDQWEEEAVEASRQLLDQSDLHLIWKPGISIERLRGQLELLTQEKPIELVVIDYLQLMDMKEVNESTDADRIGAVTRLLKELSGVLKTHILLISQFNRTHAFDSRHGIGEVVHCPFSKEKNAVPVPSFSNLKGSSSIEQDADRILLLQNHPYEERTAQWWEKCNGHVEIFIAKQRNGRSGEHGTMVKQFWEGRFRTFSKDELSYLAFGGGAIPNEWLAEQGYAVETGGFS